MSLKKNIPAWGKEVRKALIDREMTVEELAKEIGYSKGYVANNINGNFDFPDVRRSICAYLGIGDKSAS